MSGFVSFQRALLPKFLIRGHLNSTNCVITQPLTGELVVESSEAAIKSIELQLVRVETCGKAPQPSTATSPRPQACPSFPGSRRASRTAGDSPVDAPSPRVTGCCLGLNRHALCSYPTIPSPCSRLCRRVRPRRHRDSKHSDR